MSHLIFAPRGTLRKRTRLYGETHNDLRASLRADRRNQTTSDKRTRKARRHFNFKATGELHG